MRRLDGRLLLVRAHPDPNIPATSTNGFEFGKTYSGVGEAYGIRVTLDDGSQRFISADGSGGAHLQHVKGSGRVLGDRCETAGSFEIHEVDGIVRDQRPQLREVRDAT